ncbi:heavy metal translocating P-type ATPase [Marinicella gelatinilytica]|uniref:heavy metal translocating P-type ATPase n=1 Tax=Marinicella gelatinilytica TaxID=2996017 RepID=UPI002260A95B|nr:heavy metal translocating P-type ATPase [Marinicella gelatinilytica]MCX7545831.1 heavy metal translocating P-type ATPase [Marinicella gelatinilytica]
MSITTSHCFHCGEPVPDNCRLTATIDGVEQPMCCIGCQAVARFLADESHDDFYQYRDGKRPGVQVDSDGQSWSHLDEPAVFDRLTQETGNNLRQVTIKIEGMYCSACGWLIQKVLLDLPGVEDLHINSVTQNMRVEFDPSQLSLSELFSQITRLGYRPMYQQDTAHQADIARKKQLRQIAVAGFGMMFIMTLAVPLYNPESMAQDPDIGQFFRLISLLIATVVYFYAGQSFVRNAWRDITNRHLGMDVPVALSISIAYFVSVYISFTDHGHVYFDSMAMFIFFLLLGRFVESAVKHKGMDVRSALNALIPVSALRIAKDRTEQIPVDQVKKGDWLLIKSQQVVPCDGEIKQGQGRFDESLLTGESTPVKKTKGDTVYAGSRLLNEEVIIETTVNNQNTFLAKLADLMELAQSKKPKTLQTVDRIAGYFVAVVLLLAVVTGFWYLQHQPELVLPVVLSVLIATCPCALSLATPTALTAGGIKLLQQGVLVNNTEALQQLPRSQYWFFDKTGTLTEDQLVVAAIHRYGQNDQLEDIASGLQRISNHPLASAFRQHQSVAVDDAQELTGRGVQGTVSGRLWRMGSFEWLQSVGVKNLKPAPVESGQTVVYIACETTVEAAFALAAKPRQGAQVLIQWLKSQHRELAIISGDQADTVSAWAAQLGIEKHQGNMQAQDKIKAIEQVQQQGNQCVMVGDGVNDAPVLSQADVSISLKQGAHLAHSASDLIILGRSLAPIEQAVNTAKKSQRIIKQNLFWALLYNGSVTPVAMMGLLAPWMAAIGMSLSSLLVVLNSRRIMRN